MTKLIELLSFLGVCAFVVGFFLLLFIDIGEISGNTKIALVSMAVVITIFNVIREVREWKR